MVKNICKEACSSKISAAGGNALLPRKKDRLFIVLPIVIGSVGRTFFFLDPMGVFRTFPNFQTMSMIFKLSGVLSTLGQFSLLIVWIDSLKSVDAAFALIQRKAGCLKNKCFQSTIQLMLIGAIGLAVVMTMNQIVGNVGIGSPAILFIVLASLIALSGLYTAYLSLTVFYKGFQKLDASHQEEVALKIMSIKIAPSGPKAVSTSKGSKEDGSKGSKDGKKEAPRGSKEDGSKGSKDGKKEGTKGGSPSSADKDGGTAIASSPSEGRGGTESVKAINASVNSKTGTALQDVYSKLVIKLRQGASVVVVASLVEVSIICLMVWAIIENPLTGPVTFTAMTLSLPFLFSVLNSCELFMLIKILNG